MMPELGTFALCLALGLAVLLSIYPQWGAARQDSRMMAMARPLSYGMFACIALAFIILVHAFVVNDFTVAYVANNSNTRLPVYYRVAATWGRTKGRCCCGCYYSVAGRLPLRCSAAGCRRMRWRACWR